MRFSTVAVALLGAVSVSASSLVRRQFPTCAMTCLTDNAADPGTCQATDNACLCNNSAYVAATTTCFTSHCQGAELQTAIGLAQELCRGVGVTLTETPTSGAASATSSGASASGSASASASVTRTSQAASATSKASGSSSATGGAASTTPSSAAAPGAAVNAIAGLAALGLAALAL